MILVVFLPPRLLPILSIFSGEWMKTGSLDKIVSVEVGEDVLVGVLNEYGVGNHVVMGRL